MRLMRVGLVLMFGMVAFHRSEAMFARYETEQVPIGRLFTNLQQRLAQNTNSFELTYYLARLHSMAYSTNLTELGVRTNNNEPQFYYPWDDSGVPRSVQTFANAEARAAGLEHLTNAIRLYQRALSLLKRSTNADERTWNVLQTQLGLAWCLDQAGRTNDAIIMYRKTLKVAWKVEVTGEFNFKEWALDVWNDVSSGHNPIHSRDRGGLGPGVCYSEEIIGYLLRLLDPVNDATEIAQLKKDQTKLSTMGRAVTPLLIQLAPEAEFSELVDEQASVAFDLDGSDIKRKWAWLTPKAGWLVFDPRRTGRVDSALQMFGNVTFWVFWPNGYEALSALDDNGDGVLSGPELKGLAVWNDRNGNGVSDPGEVVPVEALGIQSISCSSKIGPDGMRWNPQGVTLTNGMFRASYDWIVPACALKVSSP
jgi:hypothetical protein